MIEDSNNDPQNPVAQSTPPKPQEPINPYKRAVDIGLEEGLPRDFVHVLPAIMAQESGGLGDYDAMANAKGAITKTGDRAMGAMQMMKKTFDAYKAKPDADPYNFDDNVRAGARYVKALYDQNRGDLGKILAGYYGASSDKHADYTNDVTGTAEQIKGLVDSYLQGKEKATGSSPSPVNTKAPTGQGPSSVTDITSAPPLSQAASDAIKPFIQRTQAQDDIEKMQIVFSPQGSKAAKGFDPEKKIVYRIPVSRFDMPTIIASKSPLQEFTYEYFRNLGLDKKQTDEYLQATGWKLYDPEGLTKSLSAISQSMGQQVQPERGQGPGFMPSTKDLQQIQQQITIPCDVNVSIAASVEAYKKGGPTAAAEVMAKMKNMSSQYDQSLHEITDDERLKFSKMIVDMDAIGKAADTSMVGKAVGAIGGALGISEFDFAKKMVAAKLGSIKAIQNNLQFWKGFLPDSVVPNAVVDTFKIIFPNSTLPDKIVGGIREIAPYDITHKAIDTALKNMDSTLKTAGSGKAYEDIMKQMSAGEQTIFQGIDMGAMLLRNAAMSGWLKMLTVPAEAATFGSFASKAITSTDAAIAQSIGSGTMMFDTLIGNLDKKPEERANAMTTMAMISAMPWASKGVMALGRKLTGAAGWNPFLASQIGKVMAPAQAYELTEGTLTAMGAGGKMYSDTINSGGTKNQALAAAFMGFAPATVLHLGPILAAGAKPEVGVAKFTGDIPYNLNNMSPEFKAKVQQIIASGMDHPLVSNLIDMETRNRASAMGLDSDAIKIAFDKLRSVSERRKAQGGMPLDMPPKLVEDYMKVLNIHANLWTEYGYNGMGVLGAASFNGVVPPDVIMANAARAPMVTTIGSVMKEAAKYAPEVHFENGVAGISLSTSDARTTAQKILGDPKASDHAIKFAHDLLTQADIAEAPDADGSSFGRVGIVNTEGKQPGTAMIHEAYHAGQQKAYNRAQAKAHEEAQAIQNDPELLAKYEQAYGKAGARMILDAKAKQAASISEQAKTDFTGAAEKPELLKAGENQIQLNKSMYNPEVRNNTLTRLLGSQERADAVTNKINEGLKKLGYDVNPDNPNTRIWETVPNLFSKRFLKTNGISPKEAEAVTISEIESLNLDSKELQDLSRYLPKELGDAWNKFLKDRNTTEYEATEPEQQSSKAGSGKTNSNVSPQGAGGSQKPVQGTNAQSGTASSGVSQGRPSERAAETANGESNSVSTEAGSSKAEERNGAEEGRVKSITELASEHTKKQGQADTKELTRQASERRAKAKADAEKAKQNEEDKKEELKASKQAAKVLPVPDNIVDGKPNRESVPTTKSERQVSEGIPVPDQILEAKGKSKERARKAKGETTTEESKGVADKTAPASKEEFTQATSKGVKEKQAKDLDPYELAEIREKYRNGEYKPGQTIVLSTGVKVRIPTYEADKYKLTKKYAGEQLTGKASNKGEEDLVNANASMSGSAKEPTAYGQTARDFRASLAKDSDKRTAFLSAFGMDEGKNNSATADKIHAAINLSMNNPNWGLKRVGQAIENGMRMSSDRAEAKGLSNTPSSELMAWADRRGLGDQMPEGIKQVGREVTKQKKGNTVSLYSREQVESPEFKDWHKGSKVVDEEGNPKVVYHGTSKDRDFNSFKIPKSGAWFIENTELASEYAINNDSQSLKTEDGRNYTRVNDKPRVIPAYLSIKNPYTPDGLEMNAMITSTNYKKVQGIVFEKARAAGYDGVYMGGGVWVAFKPEDIKSAISNKGTFDKNSKNILHSKEAPGETDEHGFYSDAERAIKTKFKDKIGVNELENFVKNGGVIKGDEAKWSGLDDYITGQKMKGVKSVNKEDVLKYINANRITLEPKVFGEKEPEEHTKLVNDIYKSYKDARDELFRARINRAGAEQKFAEVMDNPNSTEAEIQAALKNQHEAGKKVSEVLDKIVKLENIYGELAGKYDDISKTFHEVHTLPGADEGSYREMLFKLNNPYSRGNEPMFEEHWKDEKNVLAHARYDDRPTSDGLNSRHVDEIQSDWIQKGKKGFRDSDPVLDKVKLDKLAAEADKAQARYDDILNQKEAAYKESQDIDNLLNAARAEGTFAHLRMLNRFTEASERSSKLYDDLMKAHDEKWAAHRKYVDYKKLPIEAPMKDTWHETVFRKLLYDAVKDGKDLLTWNKGEVHADRWSADADSSRRRGLVQFYDNTLVNYAKKFAAKFGAKVGEVNIRIGNSNDAEDFLSEFRHENQATTKAHSIEINQKMRDSLVNGVPLFSREESGPETEFSHRPLMDTSKPLYARLPDIAPEIQKARTAVTGHIQTTPLEKAASKKMWDAVDAAWKSGDEKAFGAAVFHAQTHDAKIAANYQSKIDRAGNFAGSALRALTITSLLGRIRDVTGTFTNVAVKSAALQGTKTLAKGIDKMQEGIAKDKAASLGVKYQGVKSSANPYSEIFPNLHIAEWPSSLAEGYFKAIRTDIPEMIKDGYSSYQIAHGLHTSFAPVQLGTGRAAEAASTAVNRLGALSGGAFDSMALRGVKTFILHQFAADHAAQFPKAQRAAEAQKFLDNLPEHAETMSNVLAEAWSYNNRNAFNDVIGSAVDRIPTDIGKAAARAGLAVWMRYTKMPHNVWQQAVRYATGPAALLWDITAIRKAMFDSYDPHTGKYNMSVEDRAMAMNRLTDSAIGTALTSTVALGSLLARNTILNWFQNNVASPYDKRTQDINHNDQAKHMSPGDMKLPWFSKVLPNNALGNIQQALVNYRSWMNNVSVPQVNRNTGEQKEPAGYLPAMKDLAQNLFMDHPLGKGVAGVNSFIQGDSDPARNEFNPVGSLGFVRSIVSNTDPFRRKPERGNFKENIKLDLGMGQDLPRKVTTAGDFIRKPSESNAYMVDYYNSDGLKEVTRLGLSYPFHVVNKAGSKLTPQEQEQESVEAGKYMDNLVTSVVRSPEYNSLGSDKEKTKMLNDLMKQGTANKNIGMPVEYMTHNANIKTQQSKLFSEIEPMLKGMDSRQKQEVHAQLGRRLSAFAVKDSELTEPGNVDLVDKKIALQEFLQDKESLREAVNDIKESLQEKPKPYYKRK